MPLQDRIASSAAHAVRCPGTGCGNGGPVERVEKQKQLYHSFHRPLEISQKARDFHIPTARLRPGWKSGKPNPGFPLFHAGLRDDGDLPVIRIRKKQHQHQHQPKETGNSLLHQPRFQDHLVLEMKPGFRIILRLENADVTGT